MAQTGFTPIQLYSSSTPTNAPSASNLTNDTKGSELAINIADKNLFFKDSTNAVNTVPIRQSGAASNGWLSSTDWNTFNNKQPALVSGTNIKTVSGTTLLGSGDLGTIGVAYGGTGASTASITSFNNITGYTASGATGTTSANLVFSTSPSITTPTLVGNVTMSTGNLVIGTSGKGIDFSATAGTGTSELLNDYEEGTWTATVTPSSGSFTTITLGNTSYTKVGNLVTVTCRFTITAVGTGSGTINIAGLPYTASAQYSSQPFSCRRVNDGVTLFGQINGSTLIEIATVAGAASIVNGNIYTFCAFYTV